MDQSSALMQRAFGPRNSLCIAWSTLQNLSAVVNVKDGVKWKLAAGSVQAGEVFQEPVDHWSIRVNGTTPWAEKYSQSIRDSLSGLSKNLFALEWSVIHGIEGMKD